MADKNTSEHVLMQSKAFKKKSDEEKIIKGDWNGWGEYMQAKIQKLDAQFKEEVPSRSQEGDIPKIFQNVVIHINGYTVPPADELRRLIYLHGGRYQQYYTKRSVTHIIATNLPNSKIRELRDELVVHPSWILDSIKAGILLPVDEYLLYHQRKVAQKVLNFKAKPSTTCTMAVPFSGVVPSKTTLSGVAQITKEVPSGDIASLSVNCMQPSRGELATCTLLASPSANPEERSNSKDNKKEADRFSKESDPFAEETTSLPQNSITVSEGQDFGKDEVEVQNCNDASLLDTIDNTVLKKPYKQSLTSMSRANDANFVSEFYNNSRLHYLSTWGAEFKKYTSDIIKSLAAKSWRKRGVGRVGTHGRVIMHIDMDSFFVSVTLRDQPHLRGKPIAVCHAGKGTSSTNEQQGTSPKKPPSFFNSMSEIASCSYEARASGVRNGMFLGSARKLCPDIHCVPYQFEEYRKVSQRLYDILVTYSHEIEAVSCDEAYIDVSEALEEDETPTELAEKIRADIKEATGCTASVGIAANVLLARMCTRVAKPDGCYHLSANDDINQFMGSQKVNDLPGVGWSLGHKLETLGVLTCLDLQKFSLQMLQKEFGPKTGLLLYQYCRGVDDRALKIERERKSVSAEINYGIRFTAENEVVNFINELAKEVQKRLQALETKGRCITLKMKVRKAGAPSPRKFMGHGICDNIARSFTLPTVTDDAQIISKQCEVLLKQLNVIPEDMRGMGIQVSKLVDKNANADNKNSRSLFDFLKPQATSAAEVLPEATAIENRVEHEQVSGVLKSPENEQSKVPPLPRFSPQIAEGARNTASRRSLGDLDESLYLPSPSQIDPSVLEALPEDIRRSIERSYAARNQNILRIHDGKEEQGELGRRPQPQQKATTNRQSKTLPKPSRLQFEENPPNGTVQWISDLLPSPSQIDPEFLVALPDHVRQEIEQAYKGKDLKITSARIHVNARANPHFEVLPTKNGMEMSTGTVHCGDFQNREGAEFDSPTNQACLGEAVTLPQVKQVIKQWTQAYEVPLEEDVEVLRNYLIQLVGTQNLEQLWRVLRFLDRTVDGRQGWQSACCAVLTQVQQIINTKYRTKLAVNSLKFAQCSVFSPENKMDCTSCK